MISWLQLHQSGGEGNEKGRNDIKGNGLDDTTCLETFFFCSLVPSCWRKAQGDYLFHLARTEAFSDFSYSLSNRISISVSVLNSFFFQWKRLPSKTSHIRLAAEPSYQLEDYKLILFQILQTNIIRIVWQTVRRITNEILGVKEWKSPLMYLNLLQSLCFSL